MAPAPPTPGARAQGQWGRECGPSRRSLAPPPDAPRPKGRAVLPRRLLPSLFAPMEFLGIGGLGPALPPRWFRPCRQQLLSQSGLALLLLFNSSHS